MQPAEIEKIKREARSERRKTGKPITQHLNQYAQACGFHTWESLIKTDKTPGTTPAAALASSENTILSPYRKLMVLGTNELLDRKLISLSPDDESSGYCFADIKGHQSAIIWRDIGFGELSVSVWWKYDHSKHPQANLGGNQRETFSSEEPLAKRQHYSKFVGVVVSGWLERRDGKHLQGEKDDRLLKTYTRRGELENLKYLENPTSRGYAAEGRFYF